MAPVGSTGGLLNALNDNSGALTLDNGQLVTPSNSSKVQREVRSYSLDSKCIQGTTFDPIFGLCLKCRDIYNCQNCNDDGCISCDNGKAPDSNNRCPPNRNWYKLFDYINTS